MTRTVHIVANAARTPVGSSAESTAAAIRARVSRVAEHPTMVTPDGERLRCGRVTTLAPELRASERCGELVRQTWTEIATKLERAPKRETPVLLALPEVRPGFASRDAAHVIRELARAVGGDSREYTVMASGEGHAGGIAALRDAHQRIAAGQTELCIVGGVDSYLDAETIDWLDADRRLARDEVRSGFSPGEGAAFVALASDGFRKQHGLTSLATLRAVACATERRDATSGAGLLGEALSEVYLQLAAAFPSRDHRVDDLYCDINDERARATDFAFALLRTAALFRDAHRYVSVTGQTGDLGAASAPLHCALAVRAWARGHASGPLALVSGASWGGLRGAALLQSPKS